MLTVSIKSGAEITFQPWIAHYLTGKNVQLNNRGGFATSDKIVNLISINIRMTILIIACVIALFMKNAQKYQLSHLQLHLHQVEHQHQSVINQLHLVNGIVIRKQLFGIKFKMLTKGLPAKVAFLIH